MNAYYLNKKLDIIKLWLSARISYREPRITNSGKTQRIKATNRGKPNNHWREVKLRR